MKRAPITEAPITEAPITEAGGGGLPPRRGRPSRKVARAVRALSKWTSPGDFARWRRDPASFIEEVLVDPETGLPFVLTDAQKVFLRIAFTLTPDGRLLYPELVFSGPKKTGKTAFAAMILIYAVLVLGGRFAEAYTCANDLEQSKGRVFQAIQRICASHSR